MDNYINKYKNKKMNINLDDGTKLICNVIDVIDLNSKYYIALVSEDESRVLIYEYVEENSNTFELLKIKDKNIFDQVESIFFNMLEEDDDEIK